MKKNIKNFLISVSILGVLIFPSLSFASTLLTVSSLTSTSVTLKAVGLSVNQEVKFTLKNNSTIIPDYFQTVSTKNSDASGAGSAKASFTGLVPEGQYLANVVDANTGSVLAMKTFSTQKTGTVSTPTDATQSNIVAPVVTLSADSITATSAKINIKIEKVDTRSFPIQMGIFYAKTGTSAEVIKLDTQNLTTKDLPYTTSISLTGIDSNAAYSYKGIIQSGTSSWSTNIYSFKTLEASAPSAENPKVDLNTEGVALSPSDITKTSVNLNAIELTPNVTVVFTLRNNINSSNTPSYFKTQKVVSDETGLATASFSGLRSNGRYTASLNYDGQNPTLGTIAFDTLPGDALIEAFNFPGLGEGVIKGNIITVTVPPNSDITAISPVIVVSVRATVSPDEETVQDFTKPVKYIVTAEDGAKKEYTVNVTVAKDFQALFGGSGTNDNAKKEADTKPVKDTSGDGRLVTCTSNCGWNELIDMVNRFINFVVFKLAMPLAAIMFAYAGFQLITSGGSSEKKSKAKGIIINVAMGFAFAVASWLIIHTISSILGYDGSWIGL